MTIGLFPLSLQLQAKPTCAMHSSIAPRITGAINGNMQLSAITFRCRHVWDKQTEFMCPRASSGAFECSFDPSMPFIADKHYTEGNAWQWTWSVS